MTKHIEIIVQTQQLRAEYVSYILIETLGCKGTVIEDDRVKGYLPLNERPDFSSLKDWEFTTKVINDEEWAQSWKKFWQPQKITSGIVICPSWEQYEPDNNEIIIKLDPGCAFGTGTHPTTRLCIQALEKITPASTMADIGTGSGVLSICAAKLGVKKVVGVDNDASVIPVAAENAQKNGSRTV